MIKSETKTLFSTIAQLVDFSEDFGELNKQLEDYAYELKRKSQGRNLTNRGGFQSKLINLAQPPMVIEKFFQMVMPEVEGYVNQYGLRSKFNLSVGELWFNISAPGHYNTIHQHVHSDFSAVYYVKGTDNSGQLSVESPDLRQEMKRFYWANRDNFNYNSMNSMRYMLTPKPGTMIVMPSHMKHSVECNESKEDRISIAWDMLLHTTNIHDLPTYEEMEKDGVKKGDKTTYDPRYVDNYEQALAEHVRNQIGLEGKGDSTDLETRNKVWTGKYKK